MKASLDCRKRIAMRFAEPKRHQVLQEVLKACGTMHENLRSGTMSYLCEVIADYGFAADALLLAQAIDKPYERVDMLIELAPLLSEPLHSQVLHEIHSVAREVDASWLAKLALQLVGLGRSAEALAVASEIRPADTRAEVLTELIPRLSEPWRSDAIPDALAAIQKMRSQRRRVAAMYTALAPHLLPTSLQIAFSVTREVKSAADRAKLLTNLALQVPQPLRGEVLDAALASAREVKGESPLAEALANLIPQLSEPKCSDVLREALAAALKTKMIEKRVPVLLKLLPYLSEPSREETLRHILELAPKLKAGNRVDTLVELSIYLQEPLLSKILQDALATVREIRDGHNGHRGTALTALVPRLPERYWPAALTAALEIDNVDDRGEAIVNLTRQLMERLQPNTFFPLWCHIVQDMASRTRGGLLSIAQALRPVIVELGGERAVEDIIQTTQDVRRWWR